MGEKRAYKPRKPGGGRKKLKPEYDAEKNLKEQMDAAVALYGEDCSLQSIADALALNPIKVRKLLITAGVYESLNCKHSSTFQSLRHLVPTISERRILPKYCIQREDQCRSRAAAEI